MLESRGHGLVRMRAHQREGGRQLPSAHKVRNAQCRLTLRWEGVGTRGSARTCQHAAPRKLARPSAGALVTP